MENILSLLADEDNLKQLEEVFKAVQIIKPLIPKFQVRDINLKGKQYIAILIEKPETKQNAEDKV